MKQLSTGCGEKYHFSSQFLLVAQLIETALSRVQFDFGSLDCAGQRGVLQVGGGPIGIGPCTACDSIAVAHGCEQRVPFFLPQEALGLQR